MSNGSEVQYYSSGGMEDDMSPEERMAIFDSLPYRIRQAVNYAAIPYVISTVNDIYQELRWAYDSSSAVIDIIHSIAEADQDEKEYIEKYYNGELWENVQISIE